MAILVLEHHPLDSSCRLGEVLRDHGHRLHTVRLHASEALPPDLDNLDGVVVMGGPMNTDEADKHPWMTPEIDLIRQAHEAGLPTVGVCLGAQLLAVALGGEVGKMDTPEVGLGPVKMSFFGTVDPLLAGLPWTMPVAHAHGCEVTRAPAGGTPAPLQSSDACKVQAFKVGMTTYGFQYHFEWTRQRIHDFVDHFADWVVRSGKPIEQLHDEADAGYAMYRQLGDRLCQNLADRLFVLERRLPGAGGVTANYHAHLS
ncbi:MAG: type 1 glutamine amidotransferase [Planctomycetota bacterium]